MKKWICVLLCLPIFTLNLAFAQQEDDIIKNTQNDIILVASAGLGGALLGLSTLSFYDKPSQHVSNIWSGAAIGIIVGVVVVAYMSAQKGSIDLTSQHSSEGFNTFERQNWHAQNTDLLSFRPVQFGTQIWGARF